MVRWKSLPSSTGRGRKTGIGSAPGSRQEGNIFVKACIQAGLPKPIMEYRFHPTRKWRIDYYFEKDGKKLALEVEGGIWKQGRHNRASGFLKDMEKYNAMAQMGIYLIRITPDKIFLSISQIQEFYGSQSFNK